MWGGAVVSGVVSNDIDGFFFSMLTFNLLEQIDRRFGVDGVTKTGKHLKTGNIYGTVDIVPWVCTIMKEFIKV